MPSVLSSFNSHVANGKVGPQKITTHGSMGAHTAATVLCYFEQHFLGNGGSSGPAWPSLLAQTYTIHIYSEK